MCGIALVTGPGASAAVFDQMLAALKPRGEVQDVSLAEGLLAGTQRLRIVDPERAAQPWVSTDARWLLCFNGDIFNHRALRDELCKLGRRFRTDSDPSRHRGLQPVGRAGSAAAARGVRVRHRRALIRPYLPRPRSARR